MTISIEAKITYEFKASAERVFNAWLNPITVRAWMEQSASERKFDVRRIEIDPRVGGKFLFSDMRKDGEAVCYGYYREIDRPHKLVFTWFTSEEEEQEDNSIVTLTLQPKGSGCVATIIHSMDARWIEWIKQTENGWTVMLRKIDKELSA